MTAYFGNGHKITRTLHGNVATYLCNPSGDVFDVLPGVYEPTEYGRQLNQFANLYTYAYRAGGGFPAAMTVRGLYQPGWPADAQAARLREATEAAAGRLRGYHRRQADALTAAGEPLVLTNGGGGKDVIERPVELLTAGEVRDRGFGPFRLGVPSEVVDKSKGKPPAGRWGWAGPRTPPVAADLATWDALVDDTRVNETARRLLVHRKLAEGDPVNPAGLVRWVYKEALLTDLDDPTLGIGKLLDKTNPFAGEDAAARGR